MDAGTHLSAGVVSPASQGLSALPVAVTMNYWLFELSHSVMFLLKLSFGVALSKGKDLQEPILTGLCFVLDSQQEARVVYSG